MAGPQEAPAGGQVAGLAARVRAPNSLGRRVLVVALGDLAHALRSGASDDDRTHPARIVEPGQIGSTAQDAIRGDLLDQVIVVATIDQDAAIAEAIWARCVQEGVKIGVILLGEQDTIAEAQGMAGAARRHAETIAIVRDLETAAGILAAIGARGGDEPGATGSGDPPQRGR